MANKFKVLHEETCKDCGNKFLTIAGKYCPKCAKDRQGRRNMIWKICEKCGKKKKMYAEQVICRGCLCEELRTKDAPKAVVIGEMIRRARQTGGKIKTIENCPNFDGGNINCVTCEPGSWKFKDCGKVITAILLMLLAILAQGYTIKATGYVRAVIVEAPGAYEQTVEENKTVVYTEIGPTLQVVF